MLLKQYKINLEFTLDIQEISQFMVRSGLKDHQHYNEMVKAPGVWEHVDIQKRLQQALLANPEVLEKYLHKTMVDKLEAYAPSLIKEKMGDVEEDEKEILQPVIESLNADDAKFFNEVIEEGIFAENTRQFDDSFRLNLAKVAIVEVDKP